MTLDVYQPCPGGLNKKIKFCCKDLIHQLDSIERKIDGGQYQAALDETNRLLEQYPDRPCLLEHKIHMQMRLEDSNFVHTVRRFLEVSPNNPIASSYAAICSCLALDMQPGDSQTDTVAETTPQNLTDSTTERVLSPDHLRAAINHLQDALEQADESIPFAVLQGFSMVAPMLLRSELYLAAREHLVFQILLDRELAEESVQLLHALNQDTSVHLLLRQDMTLGAVPKEVPWEAEYAEVVWHASRGRWRQALALLEPLMAKVDHPSLLKSCAVLHCRLAQNQQAVEVLRRLAAHPEAEHETAVEAEALAQLLEDKPRTQVNWIEVTIPVRDIDEVLTRLQSDPRFDSEPADPRDSHADDGPPPRVIFSLLDRPKASEDVENASQLPRMLTAVKVFGKETDKSARLVYSVLQTDIAVQTQQILKECVGDYFDGEQQEKVVGELPRDQIWIFPKRVMPDQVYGQRAAELKAEISEQLISETWLHHPLDSLDGKSPWEASQDPAMRIAAEAALLIAELSWSQQLLMDRVFVELRAKLGLPAMEVIDPAAVHMGDLPACRFARLDVRKLSDRDLVLCYRIAAQAFIVPAIHKLGSEIIERPQISEQVPHDDVMITLAASEADLDKSLDLILRAQKWAIKHGHSPARWKLHEFRARVFRREGELAEQLLREVQTKYIKEPGIANMMMTMLAQLGFVASRPATGAERASPATPAAAPPAVGPPSASIVDIEGSAAPASAPSGSQPGKLWLPGMD